MSRKPRTWQYGYQLSKDTGLKSGTLYPLLIRLSDQDMLESQWQAPESPGKPPRHAYRLTANGLALARTVTLPEKRAIVRRAVAGVTARPHANLFPAGLHSP
jgi:PadR family transcriptional regulator, regulatory protein PadR